VLGLGLDLSVLGEDQARCAASAAHVLCSFAEGCFASMASRGPCDGIEASPRGRGGMGMGERCEGMVGEPFLTISLVSAFRARVMSSISLISLTGDWLSPEADWGLGLGPEVWEPPASPRARGRLAWERPCVAFHSDSEFLKSSSI